MQGLNFFALNIKIELFVSSQINFEIKTNFHKCTLKHNNLSYIHSRIILIMSIKVDISKLKRKTNIDSIII